MSVIGVVFLGAVGIEELVGDEEAGEGVVVEVVAVVVSIGCKSDGWFKSKGYVDAAEDMITV